MQHFHIRMISTEIDPDTKKGLSQTQVEIGKYDHLYGTDHANTADRAAKRCAERTSERHRGDYTRIGTASFLVTYEGKMISFTGYPCERPDCRLGV